jgi:aspartyl protease family protein
MLRLALLALFGAVSAVGAAQAVSAWDPAKHGPVLRADTAMTAETAPASASSAASIAKSGDGHYWAEADVNGRRVRFLVDTGASAVALTIADAKRLGFEPEKLDYNYQVTTASGPARAAAVKLGRVSVSGASVTDVDALVIEKGLDTSLLGMTYLGRLSRFEATRTALILRP